MDRRLDQLERMDRWLLSRSRRQLRSFALLIALLVNAPIAWAEFDIPTDLAVIAGQSVSAAFLWTPNSQAWCSPRQCAVWCVPLRLRTAKMGAQSAGRSAAVMGGPP